MLGTQAPEHLEAIRAIRRDEVMANKVCHGKNQP
jgi:hypothetical protein